MATSDKDFIVAIELASSKITGVAGKKKDGTMQVLAYAEEDTAGCIKRGVVYKIEKTYQSLSSIIIVGIDVEGGSKLQKARLQRFQVVWLQERGTRNGNRLMSRRKHCPTVAGTLSDEERLFCFQQVENRKIIDMALTSFRESKSRKHFALGEPSPLHSSQLS